MRLTSLLLGVLAGTSPADPAADTATAASLRADFSVTNPQDVRVLTASFAGQYFVAGTPAIEGRHLARPVAVGAAVASQSNFIDRRYSLTREVT